MFFGKKEKKTGEQKPEEVRRIGPKETMINQIEQLPKGERLVYKLSEIYWTGLGGFAIVELNPQYPGKGKKYVVSTDKIEDGKPSGRAARLWETNKAKDAAEWILDKKGALFKAEPEGTPAGRDRDLRAA